MIASILLNRATDEGRYGDVIDVCEHLIGTYGSASNALYQIARQSPLFLKTLSELEPVAAGNGKRIKPADPSH